MDKQKKINEHKQCHSLSELGKLLNIVAPVQEIPKQKEIPPTTSTPASPEVFGEPFYNPYTFIPFPEKKNAVPREKPSYLTSDERDTFQKRFTGVIDLEIKTISPLLSMESEPYDIKRLEGNDKHEFYHALSISNDVIVPATSVRGSLRTLMTILTGGTLGYLDTDLYLYQRRDTQLKPVKTESGKNQYFLAEVIKAGNSQRGGVLQIGKTELIPTKILRELFNSKSIDFDDARPRPGKEIEHYWIDDCVNPKILIKSKYPVENAPWKIKLSGRKINEIPEFDIKKDKKKVFIARSLIDPLLEKNNTIHKHGKIWIDNFDKPTSINCDYDDIHKFVVDYKKYKDNLQVKGRGICKEGLLQVDNREPIEISPKRWKEYISRNRYGDHKELMEGDLVWIEPDDSVTDITSEHDIKSIQWARWGRSGENIDQEYLIPNHILPDCLNDDGKVDLVTDLFGQVSMGNSDTSFAGRIRPHNLIFHDCADKILPEVTLPILSSPKPGCMAFYRKGNPDEMKNSSTPLRGYKVYRNTTERNAVAPWIFGNQGTFDDSGRLHVGEDIFQKQNKTVDLLKDGCTGTVRISCRALSKKELAYLLASCTVDWRLGGGKPLGLGHCRVVSCKITDENGESYYYRPAEGETNIRLPAERMSHVAEILPRIDMYRKSQIPVSPLRYPRAVDKDTNKAERKNTRGGHVWFQRHAMLKQGKPNKEGVGLQKMQVMGVLADKCDGLKEVAAQILPEEFVTSLYGYDCFTNNGDKENTKNIISNIAKFSEEMHITGKEKSKGFQGQNQETRQQERDSRKTSTSVTIIDGVTENNIGEKVREALDIGVTPVEAIKWLQTINYFGKTKDKWKNRIEKLKSIAGQK